MDKNQLSKGNILQEDVDDLKEVLNRTRRGLTIPTSFKEYNHRGAGHSVISFNIGKDNNIRTIELKGSVAEKVLKLIENALKVELVKKQNAFTEL